MQDTPQIFNKIVKRKKSINGLANENEMFGELSKVIVAVWFARTRIKIFYCG
jgi:hypothetical protein